MKKLFSWLKGETSETQGGQIEKLIQEEQELSKQDYEKFIIENPDVEKWHGRDFECIIRRKFNADFGDDFDITEKDFNEIFSPESLEYRLETKKDGYTYFIVGDDEYTFDFEPVGVLIFFNDEIKFPKAKLIVDEIVEKLFKKTNQAAEIVINCLHDTRTKRF